MSTHVLREVGNFYEPSRLGDIMRVAARCRSEIIQPAGLFVGGKLSLQISQKLKPREASTLRSEYLRV